MGWLIFIQSHINSKKIDIRLKLKILSTDLSTGHAAKYHFSHKINRLQQFHNL